ncbi:MAG: AAA family ATPase [Gammaproteobacteria bacterium]|nr:AAA family ATPase [Gammaproteobacteria bacterium]
MAEQAYLEFFGLERPPFSIAPDPHFLYLSDRHREALAHLVWGLGTDGGFVVLTGEVGTGKTTLSRSLLERIPEDTDIAFVINPRLSAHELLATLCEELGDPPVDDEVSARRLVDRINQLLLAAHASGRRTVLVIDEAQNLTPDVLEQIRLLTNLETSERKLLQVILIGQPELDTMLRRNDLRQLAQRITARYHLRPLSQQDLSRCIRHRLQVAGAHRNPFTASGLKALHRLSKGIPRVANLIADRALLGAYARDEDRIGATIVRQAAREVAGREDGDRSWTLAAAAGLLTAAVAVGLWWSLQAGSPLPVQTGPGTPDRIVATNAASAGAGEDAGERAEEDTIATGTDGPHIAAVPDLEQDTPSAPTAASESRNDEPEATIALSWTADSEARERRAFQAVVERWFVPLEVSSEGAVCDQMTTVGLSCLDLDTTWEDLVALDLPAILRTEDGPVALLAVRDGRAEVAAEGQVRWVANASLHERWTGDATLLWQLPPGYRQPQARGSRGEAVRWLRQQLSSAGHPASGRADEFDAALESAVRSFQDRAGIEDDGIAGPLTWIHLQRLTGTGIPSITAGED